MTSIAGDADPWARRRLVRTLIGVVAVAVVLLGGLGYAVVTAVTSTRPDPAPVAAVRAAGQMPPGSARRDAIAAAPMLAVPPEAGRAGTTSTRRGPTILVPGASRVGPADVPAGFPRTPEGAVGQLAAIETAVLQGMSIDRAHQVHAAWSRAGAVAAPDWELTANVQAYLGGGAGQYLDQVPGSVFSTPVAAQVKGVDGADWVLACVLLDVTARLVATGRLAYGHCERMQWISDDGGRWVIAAGAAPAAAPSTWPGTELAERAGWRAWTDLPQE